MNVFEKMASFKPKYIIPGHGSASGLSLATNNTYHYINEGVFLPKLHEIRQLLKSIWSMKLLSFKRIATKPRLKYIS
jgi:hypothetical protein